MKKRVFVTIWLMLLLALAACAEDDTPPAQPPETEAGPTATTAVAVADSPPAATATVLPPTATAEPLAALVNGQPITQAAFEQELSRYEQAQAELGNTLPTNYRTIVLDALIEKELITQAAENLGVAVSAEDAAAQVEELRESIGGEENFNAWLATNQWTLPEFQEALHAEMTAEQVVTTVTTDVPEAVEQVRARYIQLEDGVLAQSLLDQIRAGGDFAALATQHSLDQVTAPIGGDLGYFARGSLLVPEVETAAFNLAPGETSEVVTVTDETGQTTFYLVQLIERDPERPLPAELRYKLLEQTFNQWLQEQWAQATVERFIDA